MKILRAVTPDPSFMCTLWPSSLSWVSGTGILPIIQSAFLGQVSQVEVCIFHILWCSMSILSSSSLPQSPLATILNQRPMIPMFYNMAQFRQHGGYWKEMKMKDTETETEPEQAENLNEIQDVHSESDSRDLGRVTSIPANTFSPENVGEKEEVDSISYLREVFPSLPG